MRKLIVAFVILLMGIGGDIRACNTCGCSSSNQYMGLLPQTNTNFVGFQYLSRNFSSVHPADASGILPGTSYEHYQTYQLWGRINMSRKLQLLAFVPYMINTQRQDGKAVNTIKGVGDMSVLVNYRFINTDNCAWHHKLNGGAGLKLPTGKYDPLSVATEEGLPNMQPGTHSYDVIANVNYTIRHRTVGINLDCSYTATTANSESYKFGNRTSVGSIGFYQYQKGKMMILPQAGIRYDHTAKDYTNYSNCTLDDDGGGWQLFAAQGVQAYYGKLGTQVMFYEPVSQHYASGMVNTRFRLELGLVALIK